MEWYNPVIETLSLVYIVLLIPFISTLKPQFSNGPFTATIRWLVHWPLMGGVLHLVHRGGAWAGCGPGQSPHRCTKHPLYQLHIIWCGII